MAVIVLLATEWEPSKGGVSAFNQELAAALARIGHKVECVVPRAVRREIDAAASLGVRLHSALDVGVEPGVPFDLGEPIDVVVAHGRWTGRDGLRWRDRFQASRLVHVIHVHPAQIDGLVDELSEPRLSEALRAE